MGTGMMSAVLDYCLADEEMRQGLTRFVVASLRHSGRVFLKGRAAEELGPGAGDG